MKVDYEQLNHSIFSVLSFTLAAVLFTVDEIYVRNDFINFLF